MQKYHMVKKTSVDKFHQEVNVYLSRGWRVSGNLIVEPNGDYPGAFWYFQALVKAIKDDE